MSEHAKELHSLIKERKKLVDSYEEKHAKEKKERLEGVEKIRQTHANMRSAKNDAKERDRQAAARTMMANLVSSADYPDSPPFIPHLLNVLQNILGIY